MRPYRAPDYDKAAPVPPASKDPRCECPAPRRRSLSAVIQRATADPRSLARSDAKALQRTIGNAAVAQLLTKPAPRENTTGLPDKLKAGVENLSGLALDDVRVHYHSPKPAEVQAKAKGVAINDDTELERSK